MTPKQFATQQCANYDQNECLGIGIADNGSLYRLWPPRPCDVDKKRCPYFEECVLPMANTEHPDAPKFREAAKLYAHDVVMRSSPTKGRPRFKLSKHGDRQCRECGSAVGPRKQLCPDCAKKHRKASTQKAVQKLRDVSSPKSAV